MAAASDKKAASPTATDPKTAEKTAPKKRAPAAAPLHPSYKEMVIASIASLKERNGSSRQAIKKYISTNFEDIKDHLINQAIKKGVDAGLFSQPKGASGPVKLVKIEAPSSDSATAKKRPARSAPKEEDDIPAATKKRAPGKRVSVKPAAATPKKKLFAKKTTAAKAKSTAKKAAAKPVIAVAAKNKAAAAKAPAKKAAAPKKKAAPPKKAAAPKKVERKAPTPRSAVPKKTPRRAAATKK
ncbi:linker histone H1 and H5 family-domain-containing protein [Obelidium mucronatum]|nr:linker histone H1 and H5 family-domain-containing protein [Obelidium mucronatum]